MSHSSYTEHVHPLPRQAASSAGRTWLRGASTAVSALAAVLVGWVVLFSPQDAARDARGGPAAAQSASQE